VALAVQFEPGTVTTMDALRLRSRVQENFPGYQEQPSRPPMGEVFMSSGEVPQFKVEVLPAPSAPRYWFLNADGTQLIQVQHDLAAFNWRRTPDGKSDYPRYPSLRAHLVQVLDELSAVLSEEGNRPLAVNWCEVTYINHIRPSVGENERPRVGRVLSCVHDSSNGKRFLPGLDDAQLTWRYLIPNGEASRGRLTISLSSAVSIPEAVPIWTMSLTTRLRPSSDDTQDALRALDLGREWVVRGFVELTSEEMHELWGRER
jgi:uncharacterized protein (TIGR04255 family)